MHTVVLIESKFPIFPEPVDGESSAAVERVPRVHPPLAPAMADAKKPAAAEGDAKKKAAPAKAELSAEDAELKANLELMVTRVSDPDPGVAALALEGLRTAIRTSTSSMTAVPKPLKFLRPHYDGLKAAHAGVAPQDGPVARLLADVVSLLAMTHAPEPGVTPDSLRFRLLGTAEEIGSFGHEARPRPPLSLAPATPTLLAGGP